MVTTRERKSVVLKRIVYPDAEAGGRTPQSAKQRFSADRLEFFLWLAGQRSA